MPEEMEVWPTALPARARFVMLPRYVDETGDVDQAEIDAEDMVAVAGGDTEALARIYDRHAPVMLGLGIRILKNRREAEDVLHDVFVEAWKKSGDYDPTRAGVRAWLLLRMRSRCLDRAKSAGFSRARPLGDRDDAAGTARPDMVQAADAARVRAALADLPNEQRTVLLLGYFEGLSSSEIAEREGIPVGTVKSRVAAAMAKLREALGETPPGTTTRTA